MKQRKLKRILISTMALCLGLCLNAASAQAKEADDIFLSLGVASYLEADLSEEEYVAIADAAQGAYWGYTNLGIADTRGSFLNVRKEPSIYAEPVGRMEDHSACEILETESGWAKIVSGEVEGYVSAEYLLTGVDAIEMAREYARTVAVSKTDALNVRVSPYMTSRVLRQVCEGTELEYVESAEGWVQVKLDQQEAYVSARYVDIVTKLDTALTMRQVTYGKDTSDFRIELVEFAKQYIGNPYVWGGVSLTKGADCSGFVQSVFKHFGIKIDRTSRAQSKNGTEIQISDLLPGDLIFYSKDGTINHVAMYIGSGQVVHASSPETGIRISEYDYRTPTKCRRIIQD